jgi:hypothetical protein
MRTTGTSSAAYTAALGMIFLQLACSGNSDSGVTISAPTSTTSATTAPSTSSSAGGSEATPSVALRTYQNKSAHFQLQYPSSWQPQENPDFVLSLVPVDSKAGDPSRRLSVDVPSLPPHLPGMITLSRIKSGYIKSQKKKLPDAQIVTDAPQSVPNAQAEHVVVTGTLNGEKRTLDAVLIFHSERVYVIRVDTDSSYYPQAKPAFDQMIQSLKWLE